MICLEARDTIKKMGVSAALQGGDAVVLIFTRPSGVLLLWGTHLHLVNGHIATKYIIKRYIMTKVSAYMKAICFTSMMPNTAGFTTRIRF